MTPAQLLTHVCARFSLLHVEPDKRSAYLQDALGMYADKAGLTESTIINNVLWDNGQPYINLPENLSGIMSLLDDYSELVRHRVDLNAGRIYINKRDVEQEFPWLLTYFVALRQVNFDTYQLPDRVIAVIGDYLELLISIPNYERMKNSMAAGQIDTSHLPSPEYLNERKTQMELAMSAHRAAVPMFIVG